MTLEVSDAQTVWGFKARLEKICACQVSIQHFAYGGVGRYQGVWGTEVPQWVQAKPRSGERSSQKLKLIC